MRYREFLAFITERDRVRRRKESGMTPPPWTEDAILAKYRFCNVNREDDTVTKWINENIRLPHGQNPTLLFNLCVARLFNKCGTLAEIGYFYNYTPEALERGCRRVASKGLKVFSAAYIVSTNGVTMPKVEYIARVVLPTIWAAKREAYKLDTCAEVADWLKGFHGFSDFMANQVVTDAKYTPLLDMATDRSTFVLAGPGTKRGLNRFMGAHHDAPLRPAKAVELLLEIRDNAALDPWCGVFEDLNNLSNCFCEFDKYLRCKEGDGAPKQLYKPAT